MNILRERMRRFNLAEYNHAGFIMRVWIQADMHDNHWEAVEITKVLEGCAAFHHTRLELAEKVLKVTGVNAVEAVDKDGNGEVLYKEWP